MVGPLVELMECELVELVVKLMDRELVELAVELAERELAEHQLVEMTTLLVENE